MHARRVKWLTDLLIGIFLVGLAITFLRSVGVIGTGGGHATWAVVTDQPVSRTIGDGASLQLSHGQVFVPHTGANVLQILANGTSLGLLVFALLQLRRLLVRISGGDWFDEGNIRLFRRMGLAILSASLVSILSALVLQPMIIAAIGPVDGATVHPSISWSVAGMENIWLDYAPPLLGLLLAGLALVVAEAFRSAMVYRKDSEGVL